MGVTLLDRLARHKNGRPRNWLKRFVFDKNGHPRGPLALGPAGEPKPWLERWYQRTPAQFAALDRQRAAMIAQRRLAGVEKITIISPPATGIVARMLAEGLRAAGLHTEIRSSYDQDDGRSLFVLIVPLVQRNLPPPMRRICFQMEQSTYSSWFSEEYLSVLRASLAVFDYSPRNTLWLRSRLGETPVFHVPVTPLPPDPAQMHCDKRGVLFYGDTGGTHRPPILTGLARQFDLRIEGKLFGEPMRQAIAGARVVVNLHRHAGGMLETTRVAESLSLGARVVSETSADQGDHPLLEQLIRFAPEGDVAALAAQIRAALDAGDAPPALDDVIASGQQKLFDALTTLAILPKTA